MKGHFSESVNTIYTYVCTWHLPNWQAAECLQLHVCKTGKHNRPGSSTLCTYQWNNSHFPHVIQGHRQLGQAISRKPTLWQAICYNYASCHKSSFGKQRRKAECKQKKAEQGTRNGNIEQKCFGENTVTQRHRSSMSHTFFERQLLEVYPCFTDLNPLGLLIIDRF